MALKIGIIGGSGFYNLSGLTEVQELDIDTEFGKPSDKLVQGKIDGVQVVVLARHGRGHKLNPTDVNFRANVRAMSKAGVTHVLAATACGSLREDYKPGDLCLLDSFIDRTTKRVQTFHDQSSPSPAFGNVCHVPMASPFCNQLRKCLIEVSSKEPEVTLHPEGTVVTIEGPRFSSRAESNLFRKWGCDVINMTTVPEVVLFNEAGIPYVSIAMVTDYDCWRDDDQHVSVEAVMATLSKNVQKVQNIFVKAIKSLENNKVVLEKTAVEWKERAKNSVLS